MSNHIKQIKDSNGTAYDIVGGPEFIIGSGTTDSSAKTSTWTGTSDLITEYYDGLTIKYKVGIAGQTTTTLNINGLGAEPVYLFNTTKLSTQFPVNSIITLTYHADLNSGCWMCSDYDANSNTVPTPHCTTSAGTTAKTATCTYFALKDPSYMVVTIRYSNTSTGALTLNINSTGAKPIYIDGVRASSSNATTLVAGTYFVRYEGGNYYFNTNNIIPGTAADSDKLDGHDSSYFATKEELNNLSNFAGAMKFLGTSTTAISDGATTNTITVNGTSVAVASGNVVLYGGFEYIWTGAAWEQLGQEGSFKVKQAAVSSPSASGNATAFIDTISQDANGKITVTKKNVQFPTVPTKTSELTNDSAFVTSGDLEAAINNAITTTLNGSY